MASSSYSLGDSDRAAERLRLVAKVFEPEMQAFLRESAPINPRVAVDLGCGPGYTTFLLAEATQPEALIGVDLSKRFLQTASTVAAATFISHDLTAGPLPFGPADVLFCHLLLSHLADPGAALALWATSLAPTGVIPVDEVEAIETTRPCRNTWRWWNTPSAAGVARSTSGGR